MNITRPAMRAGDRSVQIRRGAADRVEGNEQAGNQLAGDASARLIQESVAATDAKRQAFVPAVNSSVQPVDPRANPSGTPNPARLFYTGAAALLVILMLVGFQQFYLHGKAYPKRELTAPIRTLLILHGCSMTGWMLLFLAQPLLVVFGNRRLHAKLGRVGAMLAAAIVFLGFRVAIEAARVNPPDLRIWGLAPKQFLAVPIFTILIFAAFVIAGVWHRGRPEVHRPMMLMSVFTVISAAIDRIPAIRELYRGTVMGTIFGPFFGMLVIALLLLVGKRLVARSWDRWYAAGYAGLVIASVLIMKLATTSGWEQVASLLLR
jgi:hypothetical protein